MSMSPPDPVLSLDASDLAEFASLFERSSAIGATPSGGLHRLAASAEDGAVRRLFCEWLLAHGFDVKVDPVGNIFGLLTWRPGAPYVMCGSHLDSQPSAGRFDGCYGVIAAAVAAHAVGRRLALQDVPPPFNLCVVNWTNEEGARYQPSLTGSSVFIGALPLEEALALTDEAGVSLGAALAAIGFAGTEPVTVTPASYIEIHVEQGRGLEDARHAIGVVRETWAASKWRVHFLGEQNHTGPTPMAERRDALLAAAHTIVHVREEAAAHGLAMHSSVGRLEVYPNSPNVVPSSVTLLIELRSQDVALLSGAEDRLRLALTRIADATGTQALIESQQLRAPVRLDSRLGDLALNVSEQVGLRAQNSVTVAGHDAVSLARFCPSSLIFVPSANGLSHNEAEFTSQTDMENGLRFLAAYLHRICLDA